MSFFNYKAVKCWIANTRIYVKLDDGRKASLSIERFRLLANANNEQL